MTDLYTTLPPEPTQLDGNGVLARMVDAMGFRYRWATAGMAPSALSFRPCEGAMTMTELLGHMNVLVRWLDQEIRRTLQDPPAAADRAQLSPPDQWPELRDDTLTRLTGLRTLLEDTPPDTLLQATLTSPRGGDPQPFWCAINGPMADFLTHVGQVSSWRRISGDPAPPADVFRGRAPSRPS